MAQPRNTTPSIDPSQIIARAAKSPLLKGDDLARSGDLVHLSAVTTLQPGAQGVGVNLDTLKNKFGHPLAIHEIHFDLSTVGAAIGANLTYKKMPITSGFVPVWLFGHPDAKANDPEDENTNVLSGIGDADRTYVWKLPTPLLIAPQETLVPTFTHYGTLPTKEQIRVSYVGRVLTGQHMPKKMQMPFVSAYLSAPWRADVASTDTSPATDLFNSLTKTILVHRITGRLIQSGMGTPTWAIPSTLLYGETLRADPQYGTFVRMWDSIGNAIIRDTLPWHVVFGWHDDSFFLNQVLAPGAYYTAEISNSPIQTSVGTLVPTMQAQIAMIASREENA